MTAPAGDTLIEARHLGVELNGVGVLRDVSLRVSRGEIVTLIGPNGSGKTTLVRALLGLLRPQRGQVVRPAALRIGYMPQRLRIDPILPLSVRRFLTLVLPHDPGDLHGVLAETGIRHLLDAPVQSVSGGELQRVLLARALLRRPDLLVLDEPAQGVDISGQNDLYRLITRVRDARGCGVVLVSHDLHLVMASTDTVICLNRHVCCSGHPEQVARDPAFLALFGDQPAPALAPYTHRHDHEHDIHGDVRPVSGGAGGGAHG